MAEVASDEADTDIMPPTSNYAAPMQNLWDLAAANKRNKRQAIAMSQMGDRTSSAASGAGALTRSGNRSIFEMANNQIATIQRFGNIYAFLILANCFRQIYNEFELFLLLLLKYSKRERATKFDDDRFAGAFHRRDAGTETTHIVVS